MAAHKESNRRKSIAVTNQNKPTVIPRSKRRPHSIVPGDRLSPFAKARRSLVPSKSILKASINILQTDDTQIENQYQPQPISQPQSEPQPQFQFPTQTSVSDDTNATQSMDITHEFHTKIHDNTSRKSFGRRVSFAEHAQVRLFEIPDNNNTNSTNSTGSPQSSPLPASPDNRSDVVTDENAYPGASMRNRARSSVRSSLANSEGSDMDLTGVGPSAFLLASQGSGSAIDDEEFDFDYYNDGDDDMDVTEAINGNIVRKRSLSAAPLRRPLSLIPSTAPPQPASDDHDQSSYVDDQSQSQSDIDSDQPQPVDFTIPLNKSLRPPAHHDEAWLALRQATHSGNTPYEPMPSSDDEDHLEGDGMELGDAMERLMRARNSLPLAPSSGDSTDEPMVYHPAHDTDPQDDTFSSTDDSFGGADSGDHTINVSKVLGRVSLGGAARMSMGQQDSTMDESEVYGAIVPPPTTQSQPEYTHPQTQIQPTATLQIRPQSQIAQPTVFQAPPQKNTPPAPPTHSPPKAPPKIFSTPQPVPPPTRTTIPKPPAFSFTPKASTSPSKTKPSVPLPKPKFSAAFASPVARPSPKKATVKTTVPNANPRTSPKKRPHSPADNEASDIENLGSHRPSPAKRLVMAGKWPGASAPSPPSTSTDVPPPSSDMPKPKPLSPSKKAPWQAPATEGRGAVSLLRRPSGYFAKRKSVGVGLGVEVSEGDTGTGMGTGKSPKKKAGLGLGRVSMGSGPAEAWTRFDRDAGSGVRDNGKGMGQEWEKEKEKEKEKEGHEREREAGRQAVAAPSQARGSPAPASPRPGSPAVASVEIGHARVSPSSPAVSVGDLSGLLIPGAFGEEEMGVDVDMDATEQWREGVEPDGYPEDEEPLISIEQFFGMTGIRFMDELTAPRRSTHPSQQTSRQARAAAEIPLTEYVTAMAIDVPQLVLYSRVSKDLQAWIEKSRVVFTQAEEEAAKITPELFTEYSRADEEGQAELLHQLNLIRTNTRGLAKSDWYDWKLQWVEGLCVTADKGFSDLESDAKVLENINAQAEAVIPALEREYELIRRELEAEQAEVAEIEQCDQEYLNELKASIAEQNVEVEALRAEVAENISKLEWLQERLRDVDSQKREVTTAINNAKRVLHIQKHSTRAEVFRLKDELEALEDLHMFRATKVNADLFEYVYASQFRVSIPCNNFRPVVSKTDISRVDKTRTKFKDDFQRLSDFFLSSARQQTCQEGDLTIRQIVHRLADYWSSCTQLRSQLNLLSMKYPVDIEIMQLSGNNAGFKARTTVLFPSIKAKAFISFVFASETFSRWPVSIASLGCEVEVVYGLIDRETIFKAVTGRLSQASPGDNYACLLDSCIEAQDEYQ